MSQAIIEVRDLSLSFSRKKVLDGLSFSLAQRGVGGDRRPQRRGQEHAAALPGRGPAARCRHHRPLAGGADRRRSASSPTASACSRTGRSRGPIAFHCRVFAIPEFDDRLLKRLGIRPKDRISNLSAGERAILHLSLVLSQKPSLLLVDEVLHMLDPYIRDLFVEALIEAMAVQQTAVLTVNHTFSEIERLPDRVLVMERGQVHHRRNAGSAARQDEKSRQPRAAAGRPALLFQKGRGEYKEYFIYPFHEELRAGHALDFQDIALPEIIKAFIGGGYEQKRMA